MEETKASSSNSVFGPPSGSIPSVKGDKYKDQGDSFENRALALRTTSSASNANAPMPSNGESPKARRPRKRDQQEERSDPSALTDEQRLMNMLGMPPVGYVPTFYREEFCAFCGAEHRNPKMLDIFGNCDACGCILRDSINFQRRFKNIDMKHPLDILLATYGDPLDCCKNIEVTEICQQKILEFWKRDRIGFRTSNKLDEIFGSDPHPDAPKALKIRYRTRGVFAMVVLDVLPNNRFPGPTLLIAPTERYLRINKATFGHPRGLSPTGRMSYNITEIVQGYTDLLGGNYLEISANTPLKRLFGDPCPGYPKDLRINYEVSGRSGVIVYGESRGHLKRRCFLQEAPTVAPLLYIQSATYGVTPMGRRDVLQQLDKLLQKIMTIEQNLQMGMTLQPNETVLYKRKEEILEEKRIFQSLPNSFSDITKKMQVLADKGETTLFLDKETCDPNFLFGNPCPGVKKILEVNLFCQGHDSEKYTDSNEMTASGHPRNFITNKSARFVIVVTDKEKGKGKMSDNLYFETQYSSPIILITRATYGCFDDVTKLVDCTQEVQTYVHGRTLCIERTVNLNDMVRRDPCPGTRKKLKIEYTTRGLVGNLRVREINDHLVATIRLGYPPVPPIDQTDD